MKRKAPKKQNMFLPLEDMAELFALLELFDSIYVCDEEAIDSLRSTVINAAMSDFSYQCPEDEAETAAYLLKLNRVLANDRKPSTSETGNSRGAGRKSKLDSRERAALLMDYEAGINADDIARKYGVSRRTVFNVVQKDK